MNAKRVFPLEIRNNNWFIVFIKEDAGFVSNIETGYFKLWKRDGMPSEAFKKMPEHLQGIVLEIMEGFNGDNETRNK